MLPTLYRTDRDRDKSCGPPQPRQLAYHLAEGVHGHVEPSAIAGCYRWHPHGAQSTRPQGWLVQAEDLVIAPASIDQITSVRPDAQACTD